MLVYSIDFDLSIANYVVSFESAGSLAAHGWKQE